jgi:hypothetical protein
LDLEVWTGDGIGREGTIRKIIVMITMFGKIVIVNNELMKNKGTPESQTFKKKKKKKELMLQSMHAWT